MVNFEGQDFSWLNECFPIVLPHYIRILKVSDDGRAYLNRNIPCTIIFTGARHSDGKRWLHLSVAHSQRLPTWEELKEAKELFLGDRVAICIFPQAKDWVNIHTNCLHLWACLDGPIVPNFAEEGRKVMGFASI